MNYVLISPIKNEAKYLRQLVRTVVQQSAKPIIWVIVDGDSKDGSFEAAREISSTTAWIHVIEQKRFPGKDYGSNFSQAVNEGYDYAKRICRENQKDFAYVGKVDAAVDLHQEYFKILSEEMDRNPDLGIVCGSSVFKTGRTGIRVGQTTDKLMGFSDIRLYRRSFFEEMGGYPLAYAPDTILLVKAMGRGWETKIISRTYSTETRLGGSSIGAWKGFERRGKIMHFLHYHPLVVLFNSLYFMVISRPRYSGIAIITGYFQGIVRREKVIDDKEIADYFWKERPKRILIGVVRR